MPGQDYIVFFAVLVAALYAGRIFLQQFGLGKKPEKEDCAHCAPGKKSGHKPVQVFTRGSKPESGRS